MEIGGFSRIFASPFGLFGLFISLGGSSNDVQLF